MTARVPAADHTWDNTTGNWSDAARWGGALPASDPAAVLRFGSGTADYVSMFDLATGFQLNQLVLNADPGRSNAIVGAVQANTLDFTTSGAAQPLLSLNGGGTFRFGNNVRVTENANLALNVAGGSYLVFAAASAPAGTPSQSIAPVAGTATTTIDGGGTVVWRNITTDIVVNNGLVTTDADGDFLGAGALAVGAAGIVDTGGFGEAWGSISGVAGAQFRGTVSVNGASGNFTYAGTIANRPAGGGVAVPGFGTAGGTAATNSAVTKNGGHTLTLSGPNTYTGTTTITGGTLVYAADPSTANNTNGFASGAISSGAFGTGGVTLNGGTLSVDANRTIANAMTFSANTSSTVNVPTGAELTNTAQITYGGTVTKTGPGLWRITSGNGTVNAASVLNVNEGTVQLTDIFAGTGGSGDLNAAAINVNNGGTFIFGSSPAFGGENPDLPNTSYVNVNAGGTVVWNIGEDYGGINLLGGAIQMRGNINLAGSTPSELRTGTVSRIGGNPSIGGAGIVNKTTAGTVTLAGVNLNNTGGVNIQEGVISTDGGMNANGNLTFGTAATAGTLQFTGAFGTLNKPVVVNAGGGTIEVSDPFATLTYSGAATGDGRLTKAGPGALAITNTVAHTGGTTVGAGTLQVGAAGTAGVLSGDVTVNAGATLAFNRTDQITFAGNVSGAGGLSQLGTGALTLSGMLTHTGPTTVGAFGTLRVSPAALAGPVAVGDAAVLAVASPADAAGTLTVPALSLAAGGTTLRLELNQQGNPAAPLLNVTGSDGLTLNGGSHTIVVSNLKTLAVGTFTLLDYAGTPVADAFTLAPLPARTQGTLLHDTANTRFTLSVTGVDSVKWNGTASGNWDVGSDINVGGTQNFKLASNGAATNFVQNDVVVFDDTATGPTTVNVAETVRPALVTVNNSTKAYVFDGLGTIAGPGSIIKQGAGALTILTPNSYSGGTTVSSGTLNIGNGGTFGDIGTGPLVNNGTVVWNRTDNVFHAGEVSGTGPLTKSGPNTLTLTGAFTSTGTTTLAGGTLVLDAASDYTHGGTIAGAGGLAKQGLATVTLAGNNTYAGGTTITAGTLRVGNGGTAGSIAGDVVIDTFGTNNGAIAFNRSDTFTYAGNISSSNGRIANVGSGNTVLTGTITQNSNLPGTIVASAGTLTLAAPNTYLGNITAAAGATLEFRTAGFDQDINVILGGAGTVNKTGTGRLTLTQNNSFSGTFNVHAGTVLLSDPFAGSGSSGDLNAAAVNIENGGTFIFGQGGVTSENPDLPDTTFVTVRPGGNLVWRVGEQIGGVNLQGGTITMESGGITSNGGTESWTSGTLTTLGATAYTKGGGATVVKTTGGTVTIGGAAIVGSVMNIQEGSVAMTSAANLGSAAIQLGTATTTGTLEYQGATASRGGAFTFNGPGVVRVAGADAALTLTGAMGGSGALTKTGAGTLVLTGNNTLTGGVTVAAGKLLLNGQTGNNSGTGPGPVLVNAGATLGGTGSISGMLTVGGTVSPGASAGKLTAGSTTLSPGGSFLFEVSDAAGVAGTPAGWDLLQGRAGSVLTVGATSASPFTVTVVSLDAGQAGGSTQNFDPSQVYTWPLASFPGGISGFDPAAFQVATAGFTNPLNGGSFAVASNGTDLNLVFNPVGVPEPASLALAGLATAAALLPRRRRVRAAR